MWLHLQRAYVDELKIHDVDDPTIVYSLRSAKRTVVPRRLEQPKSSRQGVVDRTALPNDRLRPLFGAAVFDLAGYCDAGTQTATQDAYDDLLGVLMGPGVHTFRFLRVGRLEEEQVSWTLAGGPDAPQEGWGAFVRYAVTLEAADPRIYSSALKSASYDPTASLAGGGFAMPMDFSTGGLVFSTTTATELFVENQGNAPTPPIFTIHGPVTNPIVDNDTTVESIVLNGLGGVNLGTADTLVVDVGARAVYLNGALRRDLVTVGGTTWFELQPGLNALRLRGTNMAAGVTSLAVSFRDARR